MRPLYKALLVHSPGGHAMNNNNRLPLALLLLKLSVFAVMLAWTIDKFVRPEHAAAVYEHFYVISGMDSNAFYVIGVLELLILIGFVIGFMKRYTYGAVLLFHAVSTLASYNQYLNPFEEINLLFYAAWPMLAAAFALYYLRDADTLLTVDRPVG